MFTFIAFIISVATWSSHTFYIYARDGGRTPLYYPYAYGSAVWTDIVTSIAFLMTLALLLLYLFHLIEKYYQVQWLLVVRLLNYLFVRNLDAFVAVIDNFLFLGMSILSCGWILFADSGSSNDTGLWRSCQRSLCGMSSSFPPCAFTSQLQMKLSQCNRRTFFIS